MNNILLLYIKKVLNRLVSVHEDLTGGVNNIRSDISSTRSEIINIPMLKNSSVLKSVQSGVANKSLYIADEKTPKSYYIKINISSVNINKSFVENDFKLSISNAVRAQASLRKSSLTSSYIEAEIYVAPSGDKPTITLTGNWRVIEFY